MANQLWHGTEIKLDIVRMQSLLLLMQKMDVHLIALVKEMDDVLIIMPDMEIKFPPLY